MRAWAGSSAVLQALGQALQDLVQKRSQGKGDAVAA
jgi:hypothetical protein